MKFTTRLLLTLSLPFFCTVSKPAFSQSAGSACGTANKVIYPTYSTGTNTAYVCDGAHLVALETVNGSPLQVGIGGAVSGINLFSVNGSSYFGGNVGIGTTTPGSLLYVGNGDATANTSSPSISIDGGSARGSGVALLSAGAAKADIGWSKANQRGGTHPAGAYFAFDNLYLGQYQGNTLMTILNGGNVGIGTTSPNAKLTISGGGISTGSASNSDLAGQLTLVAGTKSYSFTGTYTGTPVCVASDTAAAPVAPQVTTTTTTLTLTVPGGSNTDMFNYICVARN